MIRIEQGFFSLKKLIYVFVFGVLLLFAPTLNAQDLQQRQNLLRLSEEYSQRFEANKAEAVRMADSLGLFVRKELDNWRAIELMRFEYGMPVYYTTHNAEGAGIIHSDKLYPGGSAGLSLTGAGQTLGIWDGGKVRNTHQEFMMDGTSRVTQRDGATSLSNHATHVAGTMIAGGVQPAAKGMSYEAFLDAYDWNNDESEMANAAADGLQVSQHSYGILTGWVWNDPDWYWFGDVDISETEDYNFGFYDYTAWSYDYISINAPDYLIIKSAGNDRGAGPTPGTQHYAWIGESWQLNSTVREINGGDDGYDCISHAGVAKNILSVGAIHSNGDMASFSSWGPSDDGRVKPDIVAKGVDVYSAVATGNTAYDTYGGTSMAGPMISGSIGLLLEHQENLYPGTELLASTMKALIIHSADDEISGAPGPDYRFGWGLMNTRKAAGIMGQNAQNAGIHIHEITLNQGEEVSMPVVATGDEPLRATIVWTDVPGTTPEPSLNPSDPMLVNDLDMRIEDPTKITHYPYILDPQSPSSDATTGDNIRDNVEMVHIEAPVENQVYTITINHKGSLHDGNQAFSLIITGNKTEGLPVVSTAGISAIGQSTATSGGNVTDEGESDVTTRGVIWGTNPGLNVFNYEEITIDGSGSGEFTSQLTGLVPETTYYVRAYATNSTGTAYGEELTFATLPFEDIT
ncbi:MAG: S8 family serine peptidase, partial [Bacteroidota bacterium]